MLNITLIIK